MKPEAFLDGSLITKSFFFVAFEKLRHLAHSEEDYLKIIMLIEKNRELAVKLQSSENSAVYKMFRQSILDQPIELGREFIERIALDNLSKMQFGMVFRDSIMDLSKINVPLLVRLCMADEAMFVQLRKVVEHFPLYFITMRDVKFVRAVLDSLLLVGLLKNDDFKHLDKNALAMASWGWDQRKNYLFSGSNILTPATTRFDLPKMLTIASINEGVQKSDVWFITTKFKCEIAKELFEAGFYRENSRKRGVPLVNMFIIAAKRPFAGQYENEITAGVVVLEHDKFAEKLIALAS